jgi:hypothetical protein
MQRAIFEPVWGWEKKDGQCFPPVKPYSGHFRSGTFDRSFTRIFHDSASDGRQEISGGILERWSTFRKSAG